MFGQILSSSYTGGENPDSFIITGEEGDFYSYTRGIETIAHGKVKITKVGALSFLEVGDNSPKFLFMYSKDFVFLQDTNSDNCFLLTAKMGKSIETIQQPKITQSSSFLFETSGSYGPENLIKPLLAGNPFVPAREEGWKN